MRQYFRHSLIALLVSVFALSTPLAQLHAQRVATTTLLVSICGDEIVDPGEECDVLGETGVYSTTIAGRQCNTVCQYGPYCGDNVLQTIQGEECDDGNNEDGDFCAADCTIEPAGSGGGQPTGGSGGGGGGGSSEDVGDTQVSIEGDGYPQSTVNILLDGETITTVRTNNDGEFSVTEEVEAGTASFGFWANDRFGTRSITFNTTFDVTQGAVTNITGVFIPPTIRLSSNQVNPGDIVTISGQAPPNRIVEITFDDNAVTEEVTSESNGDWSIDFNTGRLSTAEHLVKARHRTSGTLSSRSAYSTALQLFVGVEGQATSNSDLNRDGSVNLTDFSILIFWWGTDGGESNPPADINGNGRVSIEDFSIMLFNWTG